MAGTTGLEPAASAVTGQRSNQLNYVPSLFSYLYRKPVCLVAFLRFNRFASVACFNPVEPNSEVNGHHGDQAKPSSKHRPTDDTNPEQLSLPREGIVAEHRLIRQALTRMRVKVLGGRSSIVGFTTFTDDEMNAKLKLLPGMRRPLQCDSSPIKIARKIHGSRSRKSGRIPGLPKRSRCAALFSTWTPGD